MTAKTANWRPGPTVCRCCLAEGCYKDISTEYFWMGKREVYAEMLSDTFSVSISYSKSGGPNSNSRLICEPCISRLRDASEFRRQVLDCEKTFMQHLDPGSSSAELPEELASLDEVKVERVKIERDTASDDDFDTRADLLDDDDDDDDLDDQPLTKFASKVPKKELKEVSILEELLGNSEVSIKRKSSLKPKQSPTKKLKRSETVKATSSKALVKTIEKKKKEINVRVRNPVKQNAEVLVFYTTVYPFRYRGKLLMCVYCYEEFEDPDKLRRHRDETHETVNLFSAFGHTGKNYRITLKVDCVDLKCRICTQPFNTIEDIAKHLKEIHGSNNDIKKKLNLNASLGLLPFKLIKNNLKCLICEAKMPTLTKLCRHVATHYSTVTCDICARCYSSPENLKNHIKSYHSGKCLCRRCWKEFPNQQMRKEHLLTSYKCKPFACVYCSERFMSWEMKKKHLETLHEVQKTTYTCPDCNLVFDSRKLFYEHYKITHTDEGFTCIACDKVFKNKSALEDHMSVHTGDKQHLCTVCFKTFSRNKSLKQHMWIHTEAKRFACIICNKQFNQKVSLIGHNKTHHPEIEF